MKTLVVRSFFVFLILLFLGVFSYVFFVLSIRLDSEKVWTIANDWRVEQGLEPWLKEEKLCELTKVRAEEIASKISHELYEKRFESGEMTKIFGYSRSFNENIGSNFSEEKLFNAWLNSPPHASALKSDYQYSCTACKNNFCVQLFMN